MRLYFSWLIDGEFVFPRCTTDTTCESRGSPASHLLMDNGGLRLVTTLAWIDEGIKRIVAVNSLELEQTDWSREAWGATLTPGRAHIYSLHDENNFEVMSSQALMSALVAWKEFIQTTPQKGVHKEIEI